MVNAEILSGLRAALERGQTLRAAMMSFYNAGYAKDEIEEAARALMQTGTQQVQPQAQPVQKIVQQPKQQIQLQQPKPQMQMQLQKPVQPVQKKETKPIIQQKPKEEPKPKQKISSYDTGVKPKRNNAMIVVLILILVILIGMLTSIFLFKQQLIDWLSTLF